MNRLLTLPKRLVFGDRKPTTHIAVTSLLLAALCCIWIYPFLWMISTSLKTTAEIFMGTGLIPESAVVENYSRAWTEAHMGSYFINTVLVTVGSLIIVTICTSLLGYVLGRYPFRGKSLLIGAFVATVFIPQGFTIIPIFEMLSFLGLSTSLWGLTLATSGHAMTIYVLLFAGYFKQLPDELEDAAIVDGVSFFKTFWYVMLPLARPIVVTVIIMQVLHAWNDFLLPLVITLANPAIRTLSVGIYAFKGEQSIDWSGMAAASTISVLPIVLLFIVLQRYFINGLAGAVKG
ncbi:carbohydrate ABC transporter permease [Granulosicoccus antarcticus]|uniref:sn-glycerol-3-phosphate transport system permease protein UgpE n=1 Tax=Granulosicoccus antarcticus IMCC3135 TaxID=1192854 RepID=A0A2Z2P080_9GAMM|nr:carbohydrate ABC transporter permease [Granulosicoccus antarcticus]ASJ75651.1 Trehalose transport system permease protein SugB [Granulosicoccus antarcticus IMCC3135]